MSFSNKRAKELRHMQMPYYAAAGEISVQSVSNQLGAVGKLNKECSDWSFSQIGEDADAFLYTSPVAGCVLWAVGELMKDCTFSWSDRSFSSQ